jgi:GNAT superfamily N-acetyltransferase
LLTFVRATREDSDRVRAFLQGAASTTDGHDDLSHDYSEHLAGRSVGGLYLAIDGDQVEASCAMTMVQPKEAYLSGLRVRPDRQGQGVDEELGRFLLLEARRLGADVVRVLVGADNEAAHRLLQDKLGFAVVDQWAMGEINPIPTPERLPRDAGPAWAVDRDRLSAFLAAQGSVGLWSCDDEWELQSLALSELLKRVEDGGVALAPNQGAIEALALTRLQAREVLHIEYLRDLGHRLSALLDHLWSEARAWGASRCRFGLSLGVAERLRALVPNTEITWRGLVMERRLPLNPSES